MDAFEKTIKKLWKQKSISFIEEIEFIWIENVSKSLKDDQLLEGTDVKIKFSKQDPFTRSTGNNILKVAMYAWDGNSFPGNSRHIKRIVQNKLIFNGKI